MAKKLPIDPIVSRTERTAAICIYSYYDQPRSAQFFRETVTACQSGAVTVDAISSPYTLQENQLAELLKFIVIPDEYKTLFPSIAAVGKGLQGLAPLLSMLGDSVEAWSLDREAKLRELENAGRAAYVPQSETNAV
ncbi:hypothetical protein [Chroococcidiopsis sp.]|uniref:hypothetical protein n=1 Tax=Chroococcidiopsis sp. TaxID=3088168 RepID=UPI003F403E01